MPTQSLHRLSRWLALFSFAIERCWHHGCLTARATHLPLFLIPGKHTIMSPSSLQPFTASPLSPAVHAIPLRVRWSDPWSRQVGRVPFVRLRSRRSLPSPESLTSRLVSIARPTAGVSLLLTVQISLQSYSGLLSSLRAALTEVHFALAFNSRQFSSFLTLAVAEDTELRMFDASVIFLRNKNDENDIAQVDQAS